MKTLILALILLTASPSFAGFEGHGGGVFVCRDAQKKIKNIPQAVELVDLWEAKAVFGLDVPRTQEKSELQINRAMKRLFDWDYKIYDSAQYFLDELLVLKKIEYSKSMATIAPPSDLRLGVWKKDCPPEGLASYTDHNNHVQIQKNLFDAMATTDVAAFYVHEAVCRAERSLWNSPDTTRCRRIVSFLFSDLKLPHFATTDYRPSKYTCETQGSAPYVFDILETDRIRFRRIDGNAVVVGMDAALTKPMLDILAKGAQTVYVGLNHATGSGATSAEVTMDYVYENFDITLSTVPFTESRPAQCRKMKP